MDNVIVQSCCGIVIFGFLISLGIFIYSLKTAKNVSNNRL